MEMSISVMKFKVMKLTRRDFMRGHKLDKKLKHDILGTNIIDIKILL
jgi:hypothetical protein